MTISRRDTILIAVLINIGLLSILFMTAMHVEEDPVIASPELKHAIRTEVRAEAELNVKPAPMPIALSQEGPSDEVDNVIKEYQARLQKQEELPAINQPQKIEPEDQYIEITVKRGDALEKIAKANNTTVREIKKINHLSSDTLSIGQKLRVPGQKLDIQEEKQAQSEDDSVLYVIKSGDNPWKIARKFHVKYEDILQLNTLDEEKARNLKVGDTIRVK